MREHAPTSWFTWPSPNPHALARLFLIPYAGANGSVFRRWHESLPAGIETVWVELPGRGIRRREPPIGGLQSLTSGLSSAVIPMLRKPYALFGHSMGALIAFELARSLQRDGHPPPARVFVSGRCGPRTPDTGELRHDLPEPEFVEQLERLNGTPRAVLEDREFLRLILPALRSDLKVCANYAYSDEPPLSCRIVALGGREDPLVAREGLEAWRSETTGSWRLRLFPGDHFFLHSAKREVLEVLSCELRHMLIDLGAGSQERGRLHQGRVDQ